MKPAIARAAGGAGTHAAYRFDPNGTMSSLIQGQPNGSSEDVGRSARPKSNNQNPGMVADYAARMVEQAIDGAVWFAMRSQRFAQGSGVFNFKDHLGVN